MQAQPAMRRQLLRQTQHDWRQQSCCCHSREQGEELIWPPWEPRLELFGEMVCSERQQRQQHCLVAQLACSHSLDEAARQLSAVPAASVMSEAHKILRD